LDKALLVTARAGDQLVVTKLDRLGRSLEHLIALSTQLQTRGVDLIVLDQGIDTSTAVGRMFFQILGAIAEFEPDHPPFHPPADVRRTGKLNGTPGSPSDRRRREWDPATCPAFSR